MKKAVSLLASFALAFSLFGAPVLGFADEADAASSDQATTKVADNGGLTVFSDARDGAMIEYLDTLDATAFTAADAPTTGSVEVRLTTLLVDPSLTGGMKATIVGPVTKTVDFTAKNGTVLAENGYTARLDGVPAGTYTLTVEGPGFVTYTQNGVKVEAAQRAVVTLLDQYSGLLCAGDEHFDEAKQNRIEEVLVDVCAGHGLIPYGNFNGDGRIDNADAKALLQSIVRVRGNEALNAEDYARFGMNIMRDKLTANDAENVDDARPEEKPEGDPIATASVPARTSDGLIDTSTLDPYSEIQLTYNAGGEDPHNESPVQPQFRLANASEDTEIDLLADEPEDEAQPGESEAPTIEDTAAGTVGRVKHVEPVKVGLNAFQKLASMRGAQASAAKVVQECETAHMQVAVADGTDIKVDSGKSVNEALFNSNEDVVKLQPTGEGVISDINPVQLTVDAQGAKMDAITIAVPSDSPNAPTAGQVIVQPADPNASLITCDFVTENVENHIAATMALRSDASFGAARLAYGASEQPDATVNAASGTIVIDLKGQIPVKTITIKVTKTSSNKLAEIAQVEFLNGFENKIPEPEMNVPKDFAVTGVASKSITVGWKGERNVTGYEVEISYGGATSVISTAKTGATIKNIAGKELVNYRTYTLRVRSTNGEWRSPWSTTVTATPEASGVPKKPAAPRIVGGYDSITVSWSAAEDAEWHNLFYRKQAQGSEQPAAWIKVELAPNVLKHTVNGLELSTVYEAYVQGVNRKGTGPASDAVSAKTTPDKVKVPWYKLLNREVINKELGTNYSSVIEKVEADYNKGGDPKYMVDGDYDTYVSGAKGGYHHGGTVTFTEPCDMDTIMLTGYQGQSLNIYDLIVQAWDADGNAIKPSGGNIKKSVLTYSSKTRTVMIRTEKLPGVKKIRVAYQRAVGNSWSASTIAELAFYKSTLYSDVMAVWADSEHTQLVDGMTEQKLLELQSTVNTPDTFTSSGGSTTEEYHPSKSVLLAELENALIVCRAGSLRAPIQVDPKLNTIGAKTGVGGLNGWQPLGVAAAAGDEISVYVGRKGETGGTVPLALYVVQNNPDISNGFKACLTSGNPMKIGLNTFRIPENLTSLSTERGGSLYVEYSTSRGNNENYTVRVSGGSDIPLLDIHNVTNADVRMERIRDYVADLKKYDPRAQHEAKKHDTHVQSPDYSSDDCIANATDIVLADMMYSIPVSQVKSGIGVTASSTDEQLETAAQELSKALSAMDDMMKLFYQHKGFVKDNSAAAKYGSNNAWPTLHQNIRCVRTSGGVFMYAAGNHIGVQYGSTKGLVTCDGVRLAANGAYQSGTFFGWGVAHEIGHEINNGSYTYAEVTNNYYAQLAQATDNPAKPKTRWGSYDNIYKRVSSGAKGMSMGKTGIAMYWQLHLAYDKDYNYTTYATAAEQLDNLVFARMDAYGRNVSMAPKAEGAKSHALSMANANKDNAIMRLACAATQKNLLGFFEAWGLTPDAETKAYADQWPVEERAIQYQTDALRLYQRGDFSQGSIFGLESTQGPGAASHATVNATLSYPEYPSKKTESQSITVKLDNATVSSDMLGYEVLRNGQVVGFLRANDFDNCQGKFDANGSATFVDTINTVNNRVFEYQVRAVDKLLARGELVSAGTVKVSHKNVLDKTKWSATTNMASGVALPNETQSVSGTFEKELGSTNKESVIYDVEDYAGEDEEFIEPTEPTIEHPVDAAIDNDLTTMFAGSIPANSSATDARITIDFGEKVEVVGFRVKGASANDGFTVQTSLDGQEWKSVSTLPVNEEGIVYFSRDTDKYLYAHEAGYLRLTLPGQTSFSVTEIDVVGPQGDDAEFIANGIGILSQDEELGTNAAGFTRKIPKESLVFVGTYKGNPSFNALLLYDQNGDILGGRDTEGNIRAEEVIFAPKLGDDALLGDVNEGFWVYYIEPQFLEPGWQSRITSVKAELYRVDNALTLEGQRLVADTLSVEMPADPASVDLAFGELKKSESAEEPNENEKPEGGEGEQQPGSEGEQTSGGEADQQAALSGYMYDLAGMTGAEAASQTTQGDTMGTPIYDSPIDQSSLIGTPIYGGSVMGTPIYDDVTPLASPHHARSTLAKATARALGETFVVVIEDVDVVGVAMSLG